MMRFVFSHSHAFPGGLVVVEAGVVSPPVGTAEFSDGVAVDAEWWREGEDIILNVPGYRTAKGTAVGPRRWRIAKREDGSWRSMPES